MKFWRYFKSFDLAIVLMSLLVAISLLYALGQQKDKVDYSKWLEPVLYGVIGLLVINVSLCSVNKAVVLIINKTHKTSVKWGSLLFHLSLVLIFIGGFYGRLTRFEGYVELGEGQNFIEGDNAYLTLVKGPLFGERQGRFIIRFDRLDAFTDYRDRTKDYASQITILKNGGPELNTRVKPNKPISYNGFTIYQSKYFGEALLFKFIDKAGRENIGYINLPLPVNKGQVPTSDFTLPGTDTKVIVRLYKLPPHLNPPPTLRRGEEIGGGAYLRLSINKDNVETLKEKIFPGQSLNTKDGILSLLDIKKWSGLTVVKDTSTYPVFIGFITGIIGLILMYK